MADLFLVDLVPPDPESFSKYGFVRPGPPVKINLKHDILSGETK